MLSKGIYSVNNSKISVRGHVVKYILDALLVVMGGCLISLVSPLAIPLPFSPVPVVLAHHVALGLGACLGRRRGALAVLTYLFQGGMGWAVFASGQSGWAYLLGPTGGYLLGYLAGAYVTGYIIEKGVSRSSFKYFIALLVGNGVIYLLGVSHLAAFIGIPSAICLGCLPFVLVDGLKSLLLAPFLSKRCQQR